MNDTLYLKAQAYLDLMAYIDSVDTEICGIGKIEEDQFGTQFVDQIIILPQEVGYADVMVTAEMINAFFATIPEEEHAKWRFNWHSHVNMGVGPSGTDLNNYKSFSDLFDDFTACIFNKKGEFTLMEYKAKPSFGKFDINKLWVYELKDSYQQAAPPMRKESICPIMDFLMYSHGYRRTAEQMERILNEIKEKVTKKTVTNYSSGYGAGNRTNYANNPPNTYNNNSRTETTAKTNDWWNKSCNNNHPSYEKKQDTKAARDSGRTNGGDYLHEWDEMEEAAWQMYAEMGLIPGEKGKSSLDEIEDDFTPIPSECSLEQYIMSADYDKHQADLVKTFADANGLVWDTSQCEFYCEKQKAYFDFDELLRALSGGTDDLPESTEEVAKAVEEENKANKNGRAKVNK